MFYRSIPGLTLLCGQGEPIWRTTDPQPSDMRHDGFKTLRKAKPGLQSVPYVDRS